MDWTICARGLSLLRVTPADLLEGPCIAINGAILHEPLSFTHWLGLDEPARFIPEEVKQPWGARPSPITITKQSNLPKWTARWPELAYDCYNDDRRTIAAMLPWKKSLVHWMHWSVLGALHYSVLHGAKRIKLLGADMAGDAYAYSDRTIGRGRKNAELRWTDERRHIAEAFDEIRSAGIHVERSFPGMVIHGT